MKVRALTIGVSVPNLAGLEPAFRNAAAAGQALRAGVEAAGWEVQTVRVAANPFEDWIGGPWASAAELQAGAAQVAAACEATGLEFVNVGPARTVEGIRAIPTLLGASPCISASAGFAYEEDDGAAAAKMDAVVATMVELGRDPGTKGLANFRFCAAFGCEPATPFFPAAYHATGAPMAVSVGLENGDAVVEAFDGAGSLGEATARLQARFREALGALQATIEGLLATGNGGAAAGGLAFAGIDTSINPTLSDPKFSLVRAYERIVGEGRFGASGTLAVSEALTRAVTTLGPSIKLTGYAGLMLPAMEDHLLAARAAATPPSYGIRELLTNSAVCGVGIDTVPVALPELEAHPGRAKLLLMDLAALARKKRRPLSCRLFPVPGGRPGELTDFSSPYLCNTRIFPLP